LHNQHEFFVFEFNASKVSIATIYRIAAKLLESHALLHPVEVMHDAKSSGKNLVCIIVERMKLEGANNVLAEITS
jgi:hypothetical protein